MFKSRGHDVLGHAVQPDRILAAPGWPPRGEELVAAPAQQQGLGAQRLIKQDLGSLSLNLADPVEEALAGPQSVERDILTHDYLSHFCPPLVWLVRYH